MTLFFGLRYFNIMEDLKGKIRVYARIRPILPMETKRGATHVVTAPDELTIAHPWKDKPREYVFDSVFTHEISQPEVQNFNNCTFHFVVFQILHAGIMC